MFDAMKVASNAEQFVFDAMDVALEAERAFQRAMTKNKNGCTAHGVPEEPSPPYPTGCLKSNPPLPLCAGEKGVHDGRQGATLKNVKT